MGTLIDESDEIDMEAEWADQVARSSVSKGKKKAIERRRCNRKRIEAMQEERMLKEMIEDYDDNPSYFDY